MPPICSSKNEKITTTSLSNQLNLHLSTPIHCQETHHTSKFSSTKTLQSIRKHPQDLIQNKRKKWQPGWTRVGCLGGGWASERQQRRVWRQERSGSWPHWHQVAAPRGSRSPSPSTSSETRSPELSHQHNPLWISTSKFNKNGGGNQG